MNQSTIAKVFPAYFKNFELPSVAIEQEIDVYRACPTRKIERESFLNSYEENGFMISANGRDDDPQEYCLSTFARLRDVRRFVVSDSKYNPPWLLAKGHTTKTDGISCRTKDWIKKKTSHVDWWLYEDAQPWLAFEETTYEYEDEIRQIPEEK